MKILPLIQSDFNGKSYAFQDDNAPVHTAKGVTNWIGEKKIKILPDWPSQSPDLNPIEHRKKHPKNATELEMALKEEWSLIPPKTYSNLIKSMPKRLEACISNNGWPTRY